MMARVEAGYWVFRAPLGYRYVDSKRGGKELVRDEPLASIVTEALEGYATGRFGTQTEVKRFLEMQPEYPKDKPNGEVYQQTVVRLLGKEVYAGLVACKKWGVSLREGQHEGLISVQTYERIQHKLLHGSHAPYRADIRAEFPLRGAVACGSCSTPLTAGWSKGKCKKYPYYFCRSKGCDQYGKTIPREKIEGQFKEVLETVQPSEDLVAVASAMFKKRWDDQVERAAIILSGFRKDIVNAERQIGQLVERIVEANNRRVIEAYEKKIEELEREKLLLREKADEISTPRFTFDELFEHSLKFLSNPCRIWDSGRFELQRMVLKLVFLDHLQYDRNKGFRTPKTTLPFKALGGFFDLNEGMVPLG